MRSLHRLGIAVVCAGTAVGSVAVGCNSSSSTPSTTEDGGATTTLYARLGGHTGIRSAVEKIVAAELGDPEIASYFVYQTMSPVPAGHPNVDQLEECFTDQLASAAGGTEVYPTTVSDEAGSWTCRDMGTIHAQFHISGGTFDKFVTIAAGELTTLGVASADITIIGGVLEGTKTTIVDSTMLDAGEQSFASDGGTTTPTDSGTGTLYTRLGGHAGIRGAVDAIVKAELGDPDIASYFFNQVASPIPAGHPTVDQLSECFTDQLGNAPGGTEQYPMTVVDDAGSWVCRDMGSIHGPLKISGGTFDKFVMIAAGVLQTAGVASADITTVGGVLTGTRSTIVDSNLNDAGEMAYDAASP